MPTLLPPAHAQTLAGQGLQADSPLCGRPASRAPCLCAPGCLCRRPLLPQPLPRHSRIPAPPRQLTRRASVAARRAVRRQHPRERLQRRPWSPTLTLDQGLQPWPWPWPPRRAGTGAPASRPCPAAAWHCSSRRTRSARARRSSWTPRRTPGSGRAPAARPRPPRPANPIGFRIMHRQRARVLLALRTRCLKADCGVCAKCSGAHAGFKKQCMQNATQANATLAQAAHLAARVSAHMNVTAALFMGAWLDSAGRLERAEPAQGCRRAPAGSAAPGTRRGCARRRRTPASARPPCRRTARTARPPRPLSRCAAAPPARRPPPGRARHGSYGSVGRPALIKTWG